MNRVELENKADGVELKIVNRNSIVGRIMMLVFILVILGLPLIPLSFSKSSGMFTTLGSMIFPLSISIFILLLLSRFICWGYWGVEIIHIKTSKLLVSYDYKMFKSKPESYKGELTDLILSQDANDKRKNMGKVQFEFGESTYITVLKITKADYEQLKNSVVLKKKRL